MATCSSKPEHKMNPMRCRLRRDFLIRILTLSAIGAIPFAAWTQEGPTLLSSVPASGEFNISPRAPVVFTFSQPMDTTQTRVEFQTGAFPPVVLTTTATWSADGTRLTNTPTPLFPTSTAIGWTVTGRGSSGTELTGTTTGGFVTRQDGPGILSTLPANGAQNVPPGAPVVVTFDTPMNTTQTTVQFINSSVFPAAVMSTATSWNTAGTQLTSTPTPPFPSGALISWVLVGRDGQGKSLVGTTSGAFMTGSGGGTGPTLVSVHPADQSSGVPATAPVVFTFSTAMNPDETAAQFVAAGSPGTLLPVVATWADDRTRLTNTPAPPFPAQTQIIWSLAGKDLAGNSMQSSIGGFSTEHFALSGAVLASRGELEARDATGLTYATAREFLALASDDLANGAFLTTPTPGPVKLLNFSDSSHALEFTDSDRDANVFAAKYPPGNYELTLPTGNAPGVAALPLDDGSLPSAVLLTSLQTPPHIVLGKDWVVGWEFADGSARIDYLRLRIEKAGAVIFDTPLFHHPDALTGASNSVVVPAHVFGNAGWAEVSLTAFTFTGLDTVSIPGVQVRTARHRTIAFELRVVDASVPPPVLLTTQMAGVPVGEPFINPLFPSKGVRPLRYELVGGALPTGLALDPAGMITGEASVQGTFDASVRVTDLLGRSSTQPLRIVTVPLPPGELPPRLERVGVDSGPSLRFDVVGSAGDSYIVERSTDASKWDPFIVTNSTAERLSLRLPMGDTSAAFFRVNRPGPALPTPKPLAVTPVLNSSIAVSGVADEDGGTLRLTNAAGYEFALNVPPGALDRRETIVMTDVSQLEGLPLSGGLLAAVDLQPEGLIFDLPARLDITVPATFDPAAVMGFGALNNGAQFALQPAFTSDRTISIYLSHFSMAGAGKGTAGDAKNQAQNGPDDPMAACNQQMAAAMQACKANPDCDINSDAQKAIFAALLVQMADQVVLPKLKAAVGDEALLDDALRVWLDWLRLAQLLGVYQGDLFGNAETGELPNRVRRAGSLATKALQNGINKSCQDCLSHDIKRIYRMADLTRTAALLGLDYHEQFWACVRRCLVFELKFESEIWGGPNALRTHTKAQVKLKPVPMGNAEHIQLKLLFCGAGSWDATEVFTTPGECTVVTAPKAGRLSFPWAKITLYQERLVHVPGQGFVTVLHYKPDMDLYMDADPGLGPKEQRTAICPHGTARLTEFYTPAFGELHRPERVAAPEGLELPFSGNLAFHMTGFAPGGGPEDVIVQKPYIQQLGSDVVENTLLELRHTPQ